MAEFLIQALNETAPLRYWRGDIIQDYEDGTCKEPPSPNSGKVILLVPGMDRLASKTQVVEWWRRISYTIESSDLAADSFRIRVQATDYNPNSGVGKLLREHVESFLTKWGASNITVADNAVTFDIAILDAIKSQSFWRIDLSGMTLVETIYTQASGVHRCRVNYSATQFTSEDVENAITAAGGTVVSKNVTNKTVTFEMTRTEVRQRFQDSVRAGVERMVVRRKYRLTEAAMAAIEAANGYLTITESDWNSYWTNKATA